MQVEVKLFAVLREEIGRSSVFVELDESATVGELLDQVVYDFPQIRPFFRSLRVAVNHHFVSNAQKIYFGDELALIPPISGG